MVKTVTSPHAQKAPDSREALLQAAKVIFARKGYDGATVKDLAEEAGVNVSLVSYYFQGKEGLFRACLETIGRAKLAAAERYLKQIPKSREDFEVRIQLFVEDFLEYHIQEPELTSILHRECAQESAISRDIFRDV